MDHSTSPAPKEPPKLSRGLFQGPPLPHVRYTAAKTDTKVLKIGDKELTFHMQPPSEPGPQGAARGRGGLGRGQGKGELPFSRLERMQNSCLLRSDWLGESGAETMPIATDSESRESDWLGEREGIDSNSELETDKEHIPTFQAASPVTKENTEKADKVLYIPTFQATSPVTKESTEKKDKVLYIPTFQATSPVTKENTEKADKVLYIPTFQATSPVTKDSTDKILYILRGCPGSGKSTLARDLIGRRGRVFSTDAYFVGSDGEYAFDPKKVAVYHKRNHERARGALSEGVSPVVIDNTNTTAWEMRPYVESGLRHGYSVQFVEPDTPWRYDPEQLTLRNSHGVPLESIKRMLKRFQKHPTLENVLGKSALHRILQETGSESCPELEETLNSSTEECKSGGSSTPPPERYSIVLEPEPEPEPTENVSPTKLSEAEIPHIPSRSASLVSNQERFNQQLVQELTSSPRGSSLFCLNLQSLAVLQDILNIDKTLLGQSNFPLAQLLLPPHVISQLTHTQVANFQHNYQRYLQHIMHSRSQGSRPFIPNASSVPTSRDQSNHSQAPPVFSHQRMNNRFPAQISGGNNNGDLATSQCCNLADTLTNEKRDFRGNQGMQLNSKIEFGSIKQTPNKSIKSPDDIAVETNSFSDSLSKDTNQQQQQQISLQQTNNKEIQLRDEIFPSTTNQLILSNETSYKLESNDDITSSSSDMSVTLSPSDRSLSTSGTLENSSVILDKLTPSKPYTDSRVVNTDNRETSLSPATDNIPDSNCLKLTDNQNTILKPSLLSEGLANQTELLPASGKGVDEPSGTETKCLLESSAMNERTVETNSTPIQFQPASKNRILSEKIDWGDSSDSDKCVTSPIHSPIVPNDRPNDRAAPGGLIAPWDTWGGWNANFISQNSRTQSDEVVAKKPNFDPTIQPPRKHSNSALKSTNESSEFTPSFSRFKSLDSNAPLRSPGRLCDRPRWSDNPRVSLLPGGAEWEWKLNRNNGGSEGSSPRSDADDPRNSKPLNPFAVPWRPLSPSSDVTDKLSHLKGFFPTLSLPELKKFLTEHSSVDAAVEAIIEQAETYNLDLPMASQVPVPNKMARKLRSPKKSEKVTTPLDASAPEFKTVLLEDSIDSKWQGNNATFNTSTPETSGANNFKQMNDSSSIAATDQSTLSFPDSSNTSPLKQTPLLLELDSNLASHLVKQYGPLPGYTREGSLSPSLSRINLTGDTALLLHQLWCKSVRTEPSVDPYYVSPGQGAPWVPPEDPIQQAKSQLYNMYPGIDTQALDEILSDKNYSISATNEYITTELSKAQQTTKDSLTPSFALIAQRGSHSFPPLTTKTTRNYSQIYSNQSTKTIF